MKTILLTTGFFLYLAATSALAGAGKASPQLDISKGIIMRGAIDKAIIDSDPPVGAKYKKGDILEGGIISSGGIVSGKLDKIPDSYSVASGSIISANGIDLSDLTLDKVTISGAMIKGSDTIIREEIR